MCAEYCKRGHFSQSAGSSFGREIEGSLDSSGVHFSAPDREREREILFAGSFVPPSLFMSQEVEPRKEGDERPCPDSRFLQTPSQSGVLRQLEC